MRDVAATGDLTRKITLRGPAIWQDEDARLLATTYNGLTDSIARFQREAAQKERLLSLGRLSTVIAHEVRNPLMIIKASLRSLRPDASPPEIKEAVGVGELGRRRRQQLGGRAAPGMEPPETALAGLHRTQRQQARARLDHTVPDIDLSVIGRHQQRRSVGQRLEHITDEPIGGTQLGLVIVAEAALVGDLVDAAVVGIHEPFAALKQAPDLDRHRRRGTPADRHRAPQVGLAERCAVQLDRTDHRHRLAETCDLRCSSSRVRRVCRHPRRGPISHRDQSWW